MQFAEERAPQWVAPDAWYWVGVAVTADGRSVGIAQAVSEEGSHTEQITGLTGLPFGMMARIAAYEKWLGPGAAVVDRSSQLWKELRNAPWDITGFRIIDTHASGWMWESSATEGRQKWSTIPGLATRIGKPINISP